MWEGKRSRTVRKLRYISAKMAKKATRGNLSVTDRYTLEDGGRSIEYSATTDKPTVLNLTNHLGFQFVRTRTWKRFARSVKSECLAIHPGG